MLNVQENSRSEEQKETGRIEAFSDGVFAVAITLLVLNIQPPVEHNLTDGQLLIKLRDDWSIYLAFITSFATIGIMWINHHRVFTHIKRSDNTLLLLNLLLLLAIIFIPFPTALMSDYINQPGQHIAPLLYSGTFLFMAICFNLLWRYASHNNRLLDPKTNPQEVRAITGQYKYGPLFYIAICVLVGIYPPVGIAANLLLSIFFAIPGRKLKEEEVSSLM
jgi:uncharacterized membrane protein